MSAFSFSLCLCLCVPIPHVTVSFFSTVLATLPWFKHYFCWCRHFPISGAFLHFLTQFMHIIYPEKNYSIGDRLSCRANKINNKFSSMSDDWMYPCIHGYMAMTPTQNPAHCLYIVITGEMWWWSMLSDVWPVHSLYRVITGEMWWGLMLIGVIWPTGTSFFSSRLVGPWHFDYIEKRNPFIHDDFKMGGN